MHRRRSTRGISTAEILVGSALALMAIASMFSVFRAQTSAMAVQSAYAQSQNVTRTLMDLITRELRMAAYDPTDLAIPTTVGSCPGMNSGIMQARADLLQFRQDLNGDGDVADAGETVTYDFASGQIRRQDGNGEAVVIADGVPDNGFRFRYYDANQPPIELAPAGSPAELSQNQRNCVAKIMVTARADIPNPDPRVEQPLHSVARSEIAIRNLSLQNF
jgi:hypothetical protein